MSDTRKVSELIAAVMADLTGVAKASTNTSQNYRYRSVDDVVNAVGPVLRKHGLVCVPVNVEHTHDTVTVGKNQTAMQHVVVTVTYRLAGPIDHLEAASVGEATDTIDKATTKALAVAYRTLWVQTLCLTTDSPVTAGDEARADTTDRQPVSDRHVEWLLSEIAELNDDDIAELKALCRDERVTVAPGKLTQAGADLVATFIAERLGRDHQFTSTKEPTDG